MARYSSRRSRRARARRRRRFYRRRRFSRFARRRYYKRLARRNLSEIKKVEFHDECDFLPTYDLNFSYPTLPDTAFTPLHQAFVPLAQTRTVSGVTMNEPFSCFVLDRLNRGPGPDEQIANKVTPVKMRVYGSCIFTNQTDSSVAFSDVNYSRNAFIRLVIFQVRNGNPAQTVLSDNFSTVNPHHSVIPETYIDRMGNGYTSNNYNNERVVYPYEYSDPASLCRLFACENPYSFVGEHRTLQDNTNIVNWYNFVAYDDYDKWLSIAKAPYRQGIGSSIRILKDKVYSIKPVNNASFTFRFKTKRPSRLVCPEAPGRENEYYQHYKNPIYFLAIPCFPFPIDSPRLRFYFNVELFYRDK